MVQQMTSKRLAARARFGSLLLAGMLSGSASAQLPLPVALPFEPTLEASTSLTAPPSLDYLPSSLDSLPASPGATGQPTKQQSSQLVVNLLGLGRHPQPLSAAKEPTLRVRDLQSGLQPLGSSTKPTAAPTSKAAAAEESDPASVTRLVSHEQPATAAASEGNRTVTPALATEPDKPVALAQFTAPADEGAVVAGPVSPLPLESLLDVDIPDLAKPPAAEPPAKSERVVMQLSDSTPPSRVEIHETFAPPKPATSGSYHLSDDDHETPKGAGTRPASESPASESPTGESKASESPTSESPAEAHAIAALKAAVPMQAAAPIKLPDVKKPADVKSMADTKSMVGGKNMAGPKESTDAKTPVDAVAPTRLAQGGEQLEPLLSANGESSPLSSPSVGKPQEHRTPATVASSSSQRPLSMRIGTAKLPDQSTPPQADQHRPLSGYTPVINARPVVRAVKPILPSDSAANDADVKLCTAQTHSIHDQATKEAMADKQLSGEPAGKLVLGESSTDAASSSPGVTGTVPTNAAQTANSSAKTADGTAGARASRFGEIHRVAAALSKEFAIDPGTPRELNRQIKQMFPASQVEVSVDDEGLVVDGIAASKAEARKILALVRKTTLCPVADHLIEKR